MFSQFEEFQLHWCAAFFSDLFTFFYLFLFNEKSNWSGDFKVTLEWQVESDFRFLRAIFVRNLSSVFGFFYICSLFLIFFAVSLSVSIDRSSDLVGPILMLLMVFFHIKKFFTTLTPLAFNFVIFSLLSCHFISLIIVCGFFIRHMQVSLLF